MAIGYKTARAYVNLELTPSARAAESSTCSSASTILSTIRTGMGNRRRVGLCTTFGAERVILLPNEF
jgi:hypothetical protein